jgi:hypothetical protein
MQEIFEEIRKERAYQDERWGGSSHDDEHSVRDWVFFIVGYAGKIATSPETNWGRNELNVRRYFVKIGALAVAALEALDRRSGRSK